MRRQLVVISAILFVDALLFVVLTPLVPTYADRWDLSDAGAGWLLAAFGAGAVLGGIPGGILASRAGPRGAVMTGLIGVAASSFALALADGPWSLGIARAGQGLASSFVWAGALAYVTMATPRGRRGQALGTAFGAAIAGAVLGPLLGGLADVIGPRPAFGGVGILMATLALVCTTIPSLRPERSRPGALRAALRDAGYIAGLWLNLLVELLFATLALLAPLALDDDGFSAIQIGLVFFVAGLLEVVLNPIVGHASDRRGRLLPLRIGLAIATGVCAGFALANSPAVIVVLVLAAAVGFGSIYSPAIALVSDRAEAIGLGQGMAFGVMNTAWAFGLLFAPPVAGALSDWAGDQLPYAIGAVLALATLATTSRPVRRRLVPA